MTTHRRITLRTLSAILAAAAALGIISAPILGLSSCGAEPPDVPTVTAVGSEGVEAAREHVQAVLVALEEAERAIEVAPKLHAALVAARASYDAKRYSEALGHLRKAVAEAESAGVEVPPEVLDDLGLAELLLRKAGF